MFAASAFAVPDTTIDSGPAGTTSDPTPTFGFSSGETGVSFECKVDDDPFAACSGPGDTHTTAALGDGPHTFEVRATDIDGPDPTPAGRSFTVDTTPPDTTIDSGPAGTTSDPTPTFGFSSGETGVSFECKVDDDPFAACSGPGDTHTTAALGDGPHTFTVRAVDAGDNSDPTPAGRSFTVDTTPPDTTIDSGPAGTTSDPTPTFGFSSGEAGVSFECKVDDDPFAACSGPGDTHTTAALGDGPHTFTVRAVDAGDNSDPTPAGRSFTVDTTPPDTTGPDTTITKRPKSEIETKGKRVKVAVSFTSEAGATFRCKLDRAEYKPCDSPYSVKAKSGAGKGRAHTISIRATDEADNPGEPAEVRFVVRREPKLRGSVARATVVRALKRHGFASRVVKSVAIDCRRRNRAAFKCRFSAGFPGYRLEGKGQVTLGGDLSYDFRVKAQGVRFTLTDENEARRSP